MATWHNHLNKTGQGGLRVSREKEVGTKEEKRREEGVHKSRGGTL